MSRKYMDFAPRRSNKSAEVVRVSLSPRSSRPSSRDSAAMARQQPAQCAKDALTTSTGYGASLGAKSVPVMVEEEEGYWGVEEEFGVDELGVVEDLETGAVEEDIERFSGEDEGVASIEDLRKPIDDRAGFKEGKSPFINTDKLEKRPLSAFRRGGKGPMPTKNSYVEQKKVEKEDNVPTMVVTGAGKGSGFSLAIIIILVTILGAVVGFVVYLAFFQ